MNPGTASHIQRDSNCKKSSGPKTSSKNVGLPVMTDRAVR